MNLNLIFVTFLFARLQSELCHTMILFATNSPSIFLSPSSFSASCLICSSRISPFSQNNLTFQTQTSKRNDRKRPCRSISFQSCRS
ncbi:hypothetical protein CPB83DRAFT_864712 [Crepidotus variabilis]|uniref:Secreted protein n=1 Tax=Crepidotus variabilis TaxID=179855 RepID=A0A9P6E4D5_9AGAR|nr:hypothetical protein CPB83DRAFT_864712 [Crepidotus variabilis]